MCGCFLELTHLRNYFEVKTDELFHDGGHYHIETSPLICCANQWAGFYMITASVMKELKRREKF